MIKLMKEYISKKLIDYCLINTYYDQQNVVQKDSYKTLSRYGFHTRKNFITNIILHYSLFFFCVRIIGCSNTAFGEKAQVYIGRYAIKETRFSASQKQCFIFTVANNLLNNTRNKILYNIGLYLCIFTHDSGDLYCSPYHCQHSCTSKKCLRA